MFFAEFSMNSTRVKTTTAPGMDAPTVSVTLPLTLKNGTVDVRAFRVKLTVTVAESATRIGSASAAEVFWKYH